MTGFLNIDKEEGLSSAREVAAVKRLTKMPCGHMGTLDPMASGVLPIAIGNAARLFDYFLNKRKTYVAEFLFGADSDTLDVTGEVVRRGDIPTAQSIERVLGEFIGEIDQIPPRYSAKNINGRRGYELAREGAEFTLPPKRVNIYDIKLLGGAADRFLFKIECGGGTYIRSIARDLGKRLGTFAVMSALKRTKSGVFTLENSVKTASLTPENYMAHIIKCEDVLDFESIYPTPAEAKRLFNGLTQKCGLGDGIYKIFDAEGCFYGLAEVSDKILKVKTKLC